MTEYAQNPPWVDRALNKNWDKLVARVGAELVPTIASSSVKKKSFTELGCGHYGCVLPTNTPGIVFKVTSDPSEARFISAYSSIPESERPIGIVRYMGVWHVEDSSHRDRPIFFVLRDEADQVGRLPLQSTHADRQIRIMSRRTVDRLSRFKDFASIARDKIVRSTSHDLFDELSKLHDWAQNTADWELATSNKAAKDVLRNFDRRPIHKAALAIRYAHIIAEEMVGEDVGYLIGEALGFCIDQGMLLADVHTGNIGLVQPEGYSQPMWIITDPGHMVPLDKKWLLVEVPEL